MTTTVMVHILGKEYQVACRAEEREQLLQASQLLDSRMRAIKQNSNVIGLERIAVMAALNLAHELLQASTQPSNAADNEQLSRLADKIESAVNRLG